MHNEDNTKSIKLDINDTEAEGESNSSVNVNLTDLDNGATADINAFDGFRHRIEGDYSYLSCYGMSV